MSLFGLFTDGRENPGIDTSRGYNVDKSGYHQAAKTFGDAARAGYKIDPNDPNVRKIAMEKGLTPEFYAANAKYYDK